MASCCQCLLGSGRTPSHLQFSNSHGSAVGDSSIPVSRRIYLGVVFPEDANIKPIHMFFARSNEGTKVLEAACAAAGLKMDRGRLAGSPDRLNIFTLEGDILRLDLDLDAHIPYTLQPDSWVILEKGNRIPSDRLAEIQEAALEAQSGGSCLMM